MHLPQNPNGADHVEPAAPIPVPLNASARWCLEGAAMLRQTGPVRLLTALVDSAINELADDDALRALADLVGAYTAGEPQPADGERFTERELGFYAHAGFFSGRGCPCLPPDGPDPRCPLPGHAPDDPRADAVLDALDREADLVEGGMPPDPVLLAVPASPLDALIVQAREAVESGDEAVHAADVWPALVTLAGQRTGPEIRAHRDRENQNRAEVVRRGTCWFQGCGHSWAGHGAEGCSVPGCECTAQAQDYLGELDAPVDRAVPGPAKPPRPAGDNPVG